MGLLQRLFGSGGPNGPPETRSFDPYFDWRYTAEGMRAHSFITPHGDIVLSGLAVAARCVALRSEIMASVPLFTYRRDGNGGRSKADDLPLYSVLHDIANPNQSAFEFREYMCRQLDLYGNAYARIERNARGQVTALYPFLHGDVQVERLPSGRLRYRIYNGRQTEIILQEDILHVRGASRDNIIGQSPITIARGALGLALTQAHTANTMAENSLRPSGLLSYPQTLSGQQREMIRDGMHDTYSGPRNAGKLMLADGGAKYETISFTPEDAQFLEQRKLSNEDIARIFGMPPTSVGITDRATYSNVEQEATAMVRTAIGPLAARVETAMARCLLTDAGRRSIYVEHDLDGLLRGDVKARFDAYRLGRECGVYSPNDVRRKENEPPIANGDIYNQPANWIELGASAPSQGGAPPP